MTKLKDLFNFGKSSYIRPDVEEQDNDELLYTIEKMSFDMQNKGISKTVSTEVAKSGGIPIEKGFNNKNISMSTPARFLAGMQINSGFSYFGRQSRGTMYQDINQVLKGAARNSVVNAIIMTRVNQVSAYAQPARFSSDGLGFEIGLKDPVEGQDPSGADLKRIKELEEFLNNLGDKPQTDKNFRSWIKAVVRDTLTYDQTNTEIVYNKDKTPKSFYAVDASTIYHASKKDGKPVDKNDKYKYVQIVDDTTAVGFKEGELTFNVMNPRTDIYAYQYGLSPLEIVLDEVIYHDMTEDFNNKYFTQGGTTMGILNIKVGGQTTVAALEDFRRDWTNMFHGTNGAWQVPVVAADDVKYINMNQSSKDMEFEKWLGYLINIITANYSIDGGEIGFPNKSGGATGSKSGNSLQEASKKDAAQLSQDKGLKPILDFIEDVVNLNIVSKFYGGKFIFRFKGDGIAKEMQLLDKVNKEVTTYLTVNESRSKLGLAPIEGGDALLNQFYIARVGQLIQKDQIEYDRKQDSLKSKTDDNTGNEDEHSQKKDTEIERLKDPSQSNLDGSDISGLDYGSVDKTGQIKDKKSANLNPQGGKKD